MMSFANIADLVPNLVPRKKEPLKFQRFLMFIGYSNSIAIFWHIRYVVFFIILLALYMDVFYHFYTFSNIISTKKVPANGLLYKGFRRHHFFNSCYYPVIKKYAFLLLCILQEFIKCMA